MLRNGTIGAMLALTAAFAASEMFAEPYQEVPNPIPATNQVDKAFCVFGGNPATAKLRVLYIGNSITRHGYRPQIGWTNDCGMAASSIDRDYVHLNAAMVERVAPGTAFALFNACAELEWPMTNAEWKVGGAFDEAKAFRPDIVVYFLGANVPKAYENAPERAPRRFADALEATIAHITTGRTRFVISEGFYNRPVLEAEKRAVAARGGHVFVRMSDIRLRKDTHGGWGHPSDIGMRLIAERFFEAMVPLLPTTAEVYSVPAGEKLYEGCRVTLNGKGVPVSAARCSAMPFNRRWPGHQRTLDQTELTGFVRFAFTGHAELAVTSAKDFKDVKVRPLSRNVKPVVEGRTVRFAIPQPGAYSVEFDGYHGNLHVFADPPKDYGIRRGCPGVRFFGPGEHDIGETRLSSGETVYLDPGAVVYGAFLVSNATDVAILGRGILDSSRIKAKILFEPTGGEDKDKAVLNAERPFAIHILDSRRIRVDGITMRDSCAYNIGAFGVEDFTAENVKIVGQWRYNTDGIDLHNIRRGWVRNCFARTFDDSFCVKAHGAWKMDSEDVVFQRCVAWSDWGRSFEVGAECQAEHLRNIWFLDCDAIHTAGVAMDIANVDWGTVSDVHFEDIRLENDVPMPEMTMQRSEDQPFVPSFGGPYNPFSARILFHPEYSVERGQKYRGAGHVRGVTVRNVSIGTASETAVSVRGFDSTHRIEGVVFDNVTVNGCKVLSLEKFGRSRIEFAETPVFK